MIIKGAYLKKTARVLYWWDAFCWFFRARFSRKYHLESRCPECGEKLLFDTGFPATRWEPGDDGDGLVCRCGWLPEEYQIDETRLQNQLDIFFEEQAEAIAQAEAQAEDLYDDWLLEETEKEQSEWNW